MTEQPGPTRAAMFWIAHNVVREAVRQRLTVLGLLSLVLLVASAQWIQQLDIGGSGTKLVLDFGFGAVSWVGSLFVAVLVVQGFFHESETGARLTVLAKPVGRGAYVLGRWSGAMALAGMFVGCAGGVLAVLVHRAGQGSGLILAEATPAPLPSWASCGWALVLLWAKLLLVAALALVVSCATRSRTLALLVVLLLVMAGHGQELAVAVYGASGDAGAGRLLRWLLELLPHFSLYDVADQLALGQETFRGVRYLGGVAMYTAAYVALCLGVATWLLRSRDD